MMMEEEKKNSHGSPKLPHGDTPYVRAKHAQVVERDGGAAIALFWKAIDEGDRVDSALKDMAVVMKQEGRGEEAIEAINSFRGRCSPHAQESLDNVLIDLYKAFGRLDDQIHLLKRKLQMICHGEAFNGKPTKTARSHGKKFQVTVKQETTRILGNLGWAYMQKKNYGAAEVVYRKAQEIEADSNKACNLCLCLVRQGKCSEARAILQGVLRGDPYGSSDPKTVARAKQLLLETEQCFEAAVGNPSPTFALSFVEDAFVEGVDKMINLLRSNNSSSSRRLPIFEEISPQRNQLAC
ncbi:unnamed protein product [Cuscuta campestris]|uniref:Protein SULFUR DEFICIENCY-INDUCED 1 n=1 Tax=Cuscuta campestris TaxID=132261 RepID=A0A484MWW2_9ASTE|nr:unnamed protein product [Cuscuta campestris]